MEKLEKVIALTRELVLAEQRAAELRKQLMEEVAAGVSRKATSPEGRVSPKEQELNVTAEERQAVQHAAQWANAPLRGDLREKVLGSWIIRGTKLRVHTQAFPGLSPAQVSGVMSALVRANVAVRVKDGLWLLNPDLVSFLEQRGYA